MFTMKEFISQIPNEVTSRVKSSESRTSNHHDVTTISRSYQTTKSKPPQVTKSLPENISTRVNTYSSSSNLQARFNGQVKEAEAGSGQIWAIIGCLLTVGNIMVALGAFLYKRRKKRLRRRHREKTDIQKFCQSFDDTDYTLPKTVSQSVKTVDEELTGQRTVKNQEDDSGYLTVINEYRKLSPESGYLEIKHLSEKSDPYNEILELEDFPYSRINDIDIDKILECRRKSKTANEIIPESINLVDRTSVNCKEDKCSQLLEVLQQPDDLLSSFRSFKLSDDLMDEELFDSLQHFKKYYKSLSVRKKHQNTQMSDNGEVFSDNIICQETELQECPTTESNVKNRNPLALQENNSSLRKEPTKTEGYGNNRVQNSEIIVQAQIINDSISKPKESSTGSLDVTIIPCVDRSVDNTPKEQTEKQGNADNGVQKNEIIVEAQIINDSISETKGSSTGSLNVDIIPSTDRSVDDTRKAPTEKEGNGDNGVQNCEIIVEAKIINDSISETKGSSTGSLDVDIIPSTDRSVDDTRKAPTEKEGNGDNGVQNSEIIVQAQIINNSISETKGSLSGSLDVDIIPSTEKSVDDTPNKPTEKEGNGDNGVQNSEIIVEAQIINDSISETKGSSTGSLDVDIIPSTDRSVDDTPKKPTVKEGNGDNGVQNSEIIVEAQIINDSISETKGSSTGSQDVEVIPSTDISVGDTPKKPNKKEGNGDNGVQNSEIIVEVQIINDSISETKGSSTPSLDVDIIPCAERSVDDTTDKLEEVTSEQVSKAEMSVSALLMMYEQKTQVNKQIENISAMSPKKVMKIKH